jgi:hypothetical protein
MKLLTANNAKVAKGLEFGYLNLILHLSPFNLSGFQVCPKASNGCASACLNTAGMGVFSNVQLARKEKTLRYFNDRENFMLDLAKDVKSAIKKANKKGLKLAIRLNGTSDLPMLAIKIAEQFPDVQFYDYTKIAKTFDRELPKNYHLTFSRSEVNDTEVDTILAKGFNVAMVFDKLPKTYKGFKVIDGDENDLRFLDEKNVVVGLKAKGKAKKDNSGFVVTHPTMFTWEPNYKKYLASDERIDY